MKTGRVCKSCEATETPMWRKGPCGIDLCNRCGIKLRRNTLVLPEIILSTQRFADMLENLPKHKTDEFISTLSKHFEKVVCYGVEPTVMDIDSDTWEKLREIMM